MPVSSREARGHFEIITSSSERLARLAASRNSTSDDTSFVDFIENMAIGQEIVAKPGSTKFAYVGRHEITHFRCFVAEVRAAMLPIQRTKRVTALAREPVGGRARAAAGQRSSARTERIVRGGCRSVLGERK